MKKLLSVLVAAVLGLSAQAAVETYKIDPVHSSVSFRVRHFVSKVPGSFTQFEGMIHFDPENPGNSSVEATVQVPSVNTANERRDNHLRSDDFFSAPTFPKITFKSTSWKKTGDQQYEVTGDLTIKETTKPVTLDVTFFGKADGPRESTLSGWEATTTLDRTEFGVGGANPVIGSEVEVEILIEAALQE